MKKLSALVFVIILILSVCGCKKTPGTESSSSSFSSEVVINITQNDNSSINSEVSEAPVSSAVASKTTVASTVTPSTPSSSITTTEPTVINDENDATNNYNSKLEDIIKNELGNNTSTSSEDFLKDVWDIVAKEDGAVFSDKKTAKDTDTVSMVNLYDEPVCSSHREVEVKILNSVLKTNAADINTNIKHSNTSEKEITAFAEEFYMKHGYSLSIYETNSDGSTILPDMYFWINVSETRKNRERMISSKEYGYIQQAIKECGISKGMLQKDAIIKFNKYISNKVEYDFENYTHDIASFFEKRKAICNSYSQVFELMCRTVGIDARFVNGVVPEGLHAWNEVEFSDGSKYYFDTCWNDSPITVNGTPQYNENRLMFVSSFTKRTVNWISPVAYMKFM